MIEGYEYTPLFPPMELNECVEKIKKMDRVCELCGSNLSAGYMPKLEKYRPVCYSHEEAGIYEIGVFTNGVSRENYNLAVDLTIDFNTNFDFNNPNKKKFDTLFNDAVSKNCRILNQIEEINRLGRKWSKEDFKKGKLKYHDIEE